MLGRRSLSLLGVAASAQMAASHAEELTLACRSGARLAALAWGDAHAPVRVLALHGWMDNAATWSALAPALSPSCRVVALDLPGHGRSPHAPLSAAYSQTEHAWAAYEAAHALGWADEREGGYALLGHSMGGGVACLLAAAFPEHVRRLALVEGFGPLSRAPGTFAPNLADALRKRHAACTGERGRERLYATLDDAAAVRVNGAKRLPGEQFLSLEAARLLAARGTEHVPAAEAGGARGGGAADGARGGGGGSDEAPLLRFSHDRRLAHPSAHTWHEAQVLGVLHSIACPTLLLQAPHGWPTPEPGFSRRTRAMREGLLRVHELEAGSHYAHLDPETAPAVQDAIVPFLAAAAA